MKTPQQWQEAYTTMLSDEDRSGMQQWIAAIQADAREGMVSKEQLRPTIEMLKRLPKFEFLYSAGYWENIGSEIARLESLLGEKDGK